MLDPSNIPSLGNLTTEESLRQWWQGKFGTSLPDDVRSFVHTLVRQETLHTRRSEHLLDDATLVKMRQGRRLCLTKLDSIEQSLDNVRAQQQRIRHFIRLNSELEKHQQRLYDIGKRHASILTQQRELERYETFEAVNGRFQRINTLSRNIEASRQLQTRLGLGIEDARRATDEAEKAMVIERQKFGETREALYRAASSMAEAQRLQMRIDDCNESHKATQERIRQMEQHLQQLQLTLQETANTINEQRGILQQLTIRRQTLDAHRRLIAKGEGVQVMLDELAETLQTLERLHSEQKQATANLTERNEQLSRLFRMSQTLQAEIDAKKEEIQGHRRNIAGQDSYSLGRRAMELRSRRQMLQTGLSLWRSIAAGYDHIETKQQLITQLRLQTEHLNRTTDTLQREVRQLTQLLDEKTYHWTLSKSQNVIELRADLEEGYPCTVCGATHHPWHSDSINEQNALIATMKSDCDSIRGELTTKSAQLHELQMELTSLQGKLAVETDNMELLMARQRKDTDEWRTFSRLDNSFAECSPSTNREARTTMIRQLIENTTIDAEDAEKTLDTFNYHLNAINGLSSELDKKQREAADLAVRLNEVNTACQVATSQVESLNQRVANTTQDSTRRRNALDKLITIPDWFHSWRQSPESLRLRIESMMEEWETLRQKIEKANTQLSIHESLESTLRQQAEALKAAMADAESSDALIMDILSKNRNALDHILQGYDIETIFAVARVHMEQQLSRLNDHIDRWTERRRESVALEAQRSDIEQTILQTEQIISSERQELDLWMRRYNASNPPVQFAELERVLADGREWGPTRKAIREIALEEAITQARVDNLRAEIIVLQAEGLRPLLGDGTEEQEHLRGEQEALEEQRRGMLVQLAEYEQQLRSHELATRIPESTDKPHTDNG